MVCTEESHHLFIIIKIGLWTTLERWLLGAMHLAINPGLVWLLSLVGHLGSYLMSQRTRWETPRGRYDKHNSKFSLSMKPKFNRPVGERNHFRRLLLTGARRQLMVRGSFSVSSNMEPAHNTTKLLCHNLQWGCQSHRFAESKGLDI
jgi:hypothetical protein